MHEMLILPFLLSFLQESDNLWWDAFATEFFEDDATLTLQFCLEDGPKRYSESPLIDNRYYTYIPKLNLIRTYVPLSEIIYTHLILFSFSFFASALYPAIGRTLIPRYFRSIFEGGVTELYYNLKHPKESFHQSSITLDCDQCTMVTHHGKPTFPKVRCLSLSLSFELHSRTRL